MITYLSRAWPASVHTGTVRHQPEGRPHPWKEGQLCSSDHDGDRRMLMLMLMTVIVIERMMMMMMMMMTAIRKMLIITIVQWKWRQWQCQANDDDEKVDMMISNVWEMFDRISEKNGCYDRKLCTHLTSTLPYLQAFKDLSPIEFIFIASIINILFSTITDASH